MSGTGPRWFLDESVSMVEFELRGALGARGIRPDVGGSLGPVMTTAELLTLMDRDFVGRDLMTTLYARYLASRLHDR